MLHDLEPFPPESPMRVAYLTTDEVNQALALEMALECGVTLFPLVPKDGPPDAGYDAVLCDWDYWPAERRQEFLEGPGGGRPARRVAVHSHNLTDGQLEALRGRGVAVYASLRPEVFHRLRLAPGPDPLALPEAPGTGGKTFEEYGDFASDAQVTP
jgi:hypothetical protein